MLLATPRLTLPFIAAAQSQKHVTVNEALRRLDALVQIAVKRRDLAAPPAAPADGDRYIVAASATGLWAGWDNALAVFEDGAWERYTPGSGWLAFIEATSMLVVYTGSGWVAAGAGGDALSSQTLGVHTTADTTNRLAVASAASLFTHDGHGHQIKLNKASSSETGSVLFQTNFGGRAELGLCGDDDLHVKVSGDGTVWRDALVIDAANARVSLPFSPAERPNLLINGDFGLNQRGFAGGALLNGRYGFDRWKADGTDCQHSVSADGLVTLTSGALVQPVEPAAWRVGSLAGEIVTLSVEDLSGGDLAVSVGGATGTLTSGSGRRAVTLTVPAAVTGAVAVRLATSGGSRSFRRVRLDLGRFAQGWAPRALALEQALAERYFTKSFAAATAPAQGVGLPLHAGFAWSSTAVDVQRLFLRRRMRSAPLVTAFASSLGGTGVWGWHNAGLWAPAQATACAESDDSSFVLRLTVSGATGGSAYIAAGHWTAEAEL